MFEMRPGGLGEVSRHWKNKNKDDENMTSSERKRCDVDGKIRKRTLENGFLLVVWI